MSGITSGPNKRFPGMTINKAKMPTKKKHIKITTTQQLCPTQENTDNKCRMTTILPSQGSNNHLIRRDMITKKNLPRKKNLSTKKPQLTNSISQQGLITDSISLPPTPPHRKDQASSLKCKRENNHLIMILGIQIKRVKTSGQAITLGRNQSNNQSKHMQETLISTLVTVGDNQKITYLTLGLQVKSSPVKVDSTLLTSLMIRLVLKNKARLSNSLIYLEGVNQLSLQMIFSLLSNQFNNNLKSNSSNRCHSFKLQTSNSNSLLYSNNSNHLRDQRKSFPFIL
jgi:hypothetical protein